LKRNVNIAARTRHIMHLLRMGLHIRNGIAIPSKKIVGYAEDVIDTCYTKRLYLLFMFAKVFVLPESQNEFAISVAARQLLKKARTLLMIIIFGTGIQQFLENGFVAGVMRTGCLNQNENSKPEESSINTLENYLAESEIQCTGTIRLT
jgi:hypothetical protein